MTLLLLLGLLRGAAEDAVELNGITCLLGSKMACLLLYQTARPKPINFMLAEGESQFGVKLLAVDAAGGRVQIQHQGAKKYLRIGSVPGMSALAAPEPVKATARPALPDAQAVAGYLAGEEVKRIQAGNPVWNGMGASAAKNNSSAGQNTSGGQNDAAGTGSGNSSPSTAPSSQNDYAGEVWYQESVSIEQSRAMTVNDVLAGTMTPWPRTPLTPANTPAQLISREVFFSNHIPGFRVTGFLNN
jgi:hypothetical protein